MIDKPALRTRMRAVRREHEAAIPDTVRALLFSRPPAPLLDLVPAGSTVAVYHPVGSEASPMAYARWFHERGNKIALPWFAGRESPMQFRLWDNPYGEDDLVASPWAGLQPQGSAVACTPDLLIVPLLGFTESGQRLGQGGGHYDRYLAAHPGAVAIGLAWDSQLVESLPDEPHDIPLRAVVTPTRFYGPF